LIEWVDCAGRTSADVAELVRLLRRARRADDARAVEARWNARRAVEDAPADGALELAAAAVAREALEAPTPPAPAEEPARRRSSVRRSSSSSGIDFAEARRLAPIVSRSLRAGSGYRGALRRFQAAAGLSVDGQYGPSSRAALRYFGAGDAPPARVALDRPEVYEPPAGAELRAPSSVSSSSSLSASDAPGGLSYGGPVLNVPAFRGGV
jgi:murein L,D-transpeptidase YcbB/YkuD